MFLEEDHMRGHAKEVLHVAPKAGHVDGVEYPLQRARVGLDTPSMENSLDVHADVDMEPWESLQWIRVRQK